MWKGLALRSGMTYMSFLLPTSCPQQRPCERSVDIIKKVKMSKVKGQSDVLPPITPPTVTPSERSVRSNKAPPAAETGSQRSVKVSSVRSGAAPVGDNPSERSHRSMGSNRSISSSVALSKLNQLEQLLMQERRAREDAESTMLALQREKVSKDDATKKTEQIEKQLAEVMNAVKSVVSQPENPSNIRKLQAVLNGTAPPPSVASGSENFAVNSDGRPRSFLDGVGQYEREREKARKEAKAQLAEQSKFKSTSK